MHSGYLFPERHVISTKICSELAVAPVPSLRIHINIQPQVVGSSNKSSKLYEAIHQLVKLQEVCCIGSLPGAVVADFDGEDDTKSDLKPAQDLSWPTIILS